MTERRIVNIVVALLVAVICFSGCAKFKEIRPVSAEIEHITPSGLRSVAVTAKVEIDNPAQQITLSDIEGVVSHSGKVIGRVDVDSFILEARTLGEYHLRAVVTLEEGTSIFNVMSLVRNETIYDSVIDIYFKASLRGGLSKKIAFEGMPLRTLMNRNQ